MPRKKSKKKLYFGPEVQDAIIRYNTSVNDSERNKIYGKEIHPAFDKLAENIINTFKFTYFDDKFLDVKNEVVAFLVMNIHKYDHTKGSKAFSYFSIVAKNYLILHNNNNYKKLKTHDDISVLDGFRFSDNRLEDTQSLSHFTDCLVKYFDAHIHSIFRKKRDISVAYAILELIKGRDGIENFNKKSLYILIREMTNVNTSNITSVVNVFKGKYKKLLNEYQTTGDIKLDKKIFF
tara:strand:- start:1339 stop:2043 length:705 start_codon:yes stop_codon:yes gene_type:complete